MAVIPSSVQLHFDGATGDTSLEGTNFQASYLLEVDDPQDQAEVVLSYFQSTIVPLGSVYAYGNDTGTTSIAQTIRARRVLPSLTQWEVLVDYGPENDGDQQDDNGDQTDDPVQWRVQVAVGTVQYQRPARMGIYRGGYGTKFESRYPVDKETYLCNSAFTPFNPSAQQDDARMWLSITKNYAAGKDVDAFFTQRYLVNSEPFQVDQRGIIKHFNKYECRIREVKIEPKTHKGTDYLAITWFLEQAGLWISPLGSRIRNWRFFPLDEGIYPRALPGDESDTGSDYGSSPGDRKFPLSTPRVRSARDDRGEVILVNMPFDGDGKPLDAVTVPAPDPVYSEWSVYDEVNFLNEPDLGDLLKAWTPPP